MTRFPVLFRDDPTRSRERTSGCYPSDALPRTRKEVAQLIVEDEQRMLDGDV